MADFESNESTSSLCDASAKSSITSTSDASSSIQDGSKSSGSSASSIDSSVSNLTDSSPTDAVSQLIPPYIRDICKEPKMAELRVAYDAPTFQTTYTYSIIWEGDITTGEQAKNSVQLKKASSRISTSSVRSSRGPTPVYTYCDGPCKKVFLSSLLNTIGRCDHYLCNACYGIVINSDGTPGCSAFGCFSKGGSRREAKKKHEKEVCRKQRVRARDMKARGIDVKSASSATSLNSLSNTSEDSNNNSDVSSETSCSFESATRPEKARFKLVYPSAHEMIGVRLVIVEPADFGIQHLFAEMETQTMTKVKHAVGALLAHKKRSDYIEKGRLYYAELQPNYSRKLRRVKSSELENSPLFHFPQIAEHIVFVMDMGGFVRMGAKISFG
ncbi:unnamed protein product [Caenorhabditis sp. 36 PRJEB53466]|nr:unnamed protein product [Caenorhabditis sp. 36 PRJEB53466]